MPIRITNLCKEYNGKPVLSHLDLTLESHTNTVLMGPSGCGKTTLLHLLLGLTLPDAGEIIGMPAKKSAVFQENRLCEQFSVLANIRLVTGKSIPLSEICRHLSAVGLGEKHLLSQPVEEFSGGMKRRLAIVRAMLADSDIILLDEPFKGMDSATKLLVMDYFRTCTAGKTTLLVTHDETEADYLRARCISLCPPADNTSCT
ncbi:MAG: ATP-binding cassette domain-containing protein [Lachnospiraceae bacterium]|nr:ATP-binding cassette domain-containing protein [Lachnospiraceae bacterium]